MKEGENFTNGKINLLGNTGRGNGQKEANGLFVCIGKTVFQPLGDRYQKEGDYHHQISGAKAETAVPILLAGYKQYT